MTTPKVLLLALTTLLWSCGGDDDTDNNDHNNTDNCTSDQVIDQTRGVCNSDAPGSSSITKTTGSSTVTYQANSIPDHKVGLFGNEKGSLNPNAITSQSESYTITSSPQQTNTFTTLLNSSTGPVYSFGVLLNGVELDPEPAEPFPHTNIMDPNVNWEWNLEALNVNLGLDCNNAHVQPTGKYHYHGIPEGYVTEIGATSNKMTLIGWAADGFPIYYKYAYSTATDNSSSIIEMKPSYQLKSGDRGGDGSTAPCGTYDGVYGNDYEYISSLGHLDEANGRIGVTPEFPSGTYYYVLTDEFPAIPRMFRGTPSDDFKLGK